VKLVPLGRREALLLAAAALLPAARARAQAAAAVVTPPAELRSELPGARLQGSGRLRFLGLRIYEARLWAGERAVAPEWTAPLGSAAPLALELEYARALEGAKIAERSLTEMRRQGEIAPAAAERWLGQMTRLFPDVREGDRLTGVLVPGQSARFFFNGRMVGEVTDGDFARFFFGIWLSPATSDPALRLALLGPARP
jgi:hypothetical protein